MDPPRPSAPPANPADAGAGASVALPAPPRGPQPGEMIGPYRVVRQLGRGGMAVVYEAEDTELPRRVALKVLADSDPQAKLRFVREAHAQAKINHEHVVAIFRVGEDRGVSYIAMPVLNGQSLAQALVATPRPPLPAVVRIASEIAEGLSAAHAAGLIHRDIKPANVWLEAPKWRVKILDFGLVRDPHANTQIDITMQGHVVGTPAYMSPEQAAGREVDHRTDLWSLGVVLYQMATGKRPFSDDNTVNLMTAIVSAEAPAPLALAPDLPPALSDLIRRLMAKNPAHRPANAAAVSAELDAIGKSLNAPQVLVVSLPSAVPEASGVNPWNNLDATEADLSRAVTPSEEIRRAVDDDDSYDGPPRRARGRRGEDGRPRSLKWLWIGGAAAAVLVVAVVMGLALDALGSKSKPTDSGAQNPVPVPPLKAAPPLKKDKEPTRPDPAVERLAAEVLAPHANLKLLIEGEPKETEVAARGALPAGKFTVTAIDFGDRERMHGGFVTNTFLPAVSQLRGLTEIRTARWQMELNAEHLRRMAAMPLASTLRALWTTVHMTPDALTELRRFSELEEVVLGQGDVQPVPNDALFERLKELPKLRHLGFYLLKRNAGLTHKGWDTVAALSLTEFTMGWSRGAPDALQAFVVRGNQLPALKFMACPDLTDQALRDHLKPTTDVRELDFRYVELTDASLETLAAVKSLKALGLHATNVTLKRAREIPRTDLNVSFTPKK